MAKLDELKLIWRNADAVSFDVDSTVTQEEGIDELAKFCGKQDEVVALTTRAMQGDVTYRQSLEERLNIVKPSVTEIEQFLVSHPSKLSPGIKTLIAALQARGKQVFFISGGFREYAGFDETQPTAGNGGKAKVIEHLKKEKGFKSVVHIGDGSTDLETRSVADLFIGYGGNVIRESVKRQCSWFVTDFTELVDTL